MSVNLDTSVAEKIVIIYGFYMEIRFSHPTR